VLPVTGVRERRLRHHRVILSAISMAWENDKRWQTAARGGAQRGILRTIERRGAE